jgi:hypothetical protein
VSTRGHMVTGCSPHRLELDSSLSLPTGTRFVEQIDFIVPVVGSERKRSDRVPSGEQP